MKLIWELEATIDGHRVNIWPEDITKPVYKLNPETRLEALSVILRSIRTEIEKEEQALKRGAELSS